MNYFVLILNELVDKVKVFIRKSEGGTDWHILSWWVGFESLSEN